MPKFHAIFVCLFLAITSISSAQEQAPQPVNEDLEIGRQYLQCRGFWGISAPMLKALGQQVAPDKLNNLREINALAALALMGDEAAKEENDAQVMKVIDDVKSLGAVKALDKWSTYCSSLIKNTSPSIQKKIVAYAKAKRDSLASPPSDAASR